MASRPVRIVFGLVIWAGVLILVGLLTIPRDGAAHEPTVRLLRYASRGPLTATVEFPPATELARNDPVFVMDDVHYLLPVGQVREVSSGPERTIVVLTLYPERAGVLCEGVTATAFRAPSTAAWVVKTLVPPERWEKIAGQAREFVRREGREIADTLWPEMRLGILDVLALYEKILPEVLEGRSDRIRELVEKHRDGVVERELVPVIEQVVLFKAEERFRPFLEKVGRELWKKLPIWSLGARALWQGVPGTADDQVKSRFERYLKKDAIPILKKHAPEAARLVREVLVDSFADPRMKEAIGKVVREVSEDPEVAALAKDLAGELILKNERLLRVIRERWEAGLGDAVAAASSRLEPLVKSIVDSIALTEDRQAINPRLARVLRSRLLRKDRRWVLLSPGRGKPLPRPFTLPGSLGSE